jgi:hypothetical protein
MKILIFLLFLFGCNKSNLDELKYNLLKEWIYADQVKINIKNDYIVDRPPGAEILIAELKFTHKTQCVYYLVPFKNKLGAITIAENKNIESCPETNQQPPLYEINNVKDLKLSFIQSNLKLSFIRENKKDILDFNFYNIKNGIIHEKFKSQRVLSLLPGLTLVSASKNLIGQLSDRFSNRHALRCQQINNKCETVGEFRCDECHFGWYEVADYNCPQGGSKFCGQNHCGEKNEPACPRGYKLYENEDTGICQGDLQAVYNEDHILVCQ